MKIEKYVERSQEVEIHLVGEDIRLILEAAGNTKDVIREIRDIATF